MVLKQMTSELYDSLGVFRNKKVRELMESPIIADVDSPISKIIGICNTRKTPNITSLQYDNKPVSAS